jgi:hypothetical protein
MLAKTRPYFLLGLLVALSLACVPLAAPAQGVPSSYTPVGIAGNPASSGRAGLASFGPNGFANAAQPFLGNCCAISFLVPENVSSEIRPPFAPEYGHRRRDDEALMPVTVPVYIPYAIGYEPDENERAQEEVDAGESTYAYGPGQVERKRSDTVSDDSYSGPPADDEAEAAEPPEPVTPQPATVLVYKDGHHAAVVNYAILGDALFDFDDEHTRKILLADLDLAATEKANDAAGVDFKLPASTIGNAPQ